MDTLSSSIISEKEKVSVENKIGTNLWGPRKIDSKRRRVGLWISGSLRSSVKPPMWNSSLYREFYQEDVLEGEYIISYYSMDLGCNPIELDH